MPVPSVQPTESQSPRIKERVVKGLTERDFQAWRHHPVTKVYLRFLSDFRDAVIIETNNKWLGGDLKPDDAEGNRAQALMLAEMVELAFGDIADFYEGPDQEENESDAG